MGKTQKFRSWETGEKLKVEQAIHQASSDAARAQDAARDAFRLIKDGDEVASIGRLAIEATKLIKEAKRQTDYHAAAQRARQASEKSEEACRLFSRAVFQEKERYESEVIKAEKTRLEKYGYEPPYSDAHGEPKFK